MTELTQASVEQALSHFQDPYLGVDYVALDAIRSLTIEPQKIHVAVTLDYPAAGVRDNIVKGLREALADVAGGRDIEVELDWQIVSQQPTRNLQALGEVKNIIAVASGKGGVGKSTTAVNLALALHAEGARVGILDADIYGPSQSIMLGVPDDTRPETTQGQYWVPVEAHGLQAMSMGFLVDENTPMVWRGPMVSGALQQMLNQTLWQQLDYLLIDMPPGTGDIQLTLAQKVPVTGAVIVTTPQDIALLDAIKGIEMFAKVEIPVLGIIENMSTHICSECGHTEAIFGSGGGERIAQQYGTPLLGQLPLDLAIREQADAGRPTLVAEPDGTIAQNYRDIARHLAALVARQAADSASAFPNIEITDE